MTQIFPLDQDGIEERRRLRGAYRPRAERGLVIDERPDFRRELSDAANHVGVAAGSATGTGSSTQTPRAQGIGGHGTLSPNPAAPCAAQDALLPDPCSTGLRQHFSPPAGSVNPPRSPAPTGRGSDTSRRAR